MQGKNCWKAESVTNKRDFEKEIQGSKLVLVLFTQEQQESKTAILPLIAPLLTEYADLSPSDRPNKLPPMRVVQHAIDFVPWSNLPNLPNYRMNPNEHKILQETMDGLTT